MCSAPLLFTITMKTFKKILFIILAILPIISLFSQLVLTACAINHTDATNYLNEIPRLTSMFSDTRTFFVMDDETRYVLLPYFDSSDGYTTLESTMLSQFCSLVDISGTMTYVTTIDFVGSFGVMLSNLGFMPNIYVIFAVYLLWYWFIIMMGYALWELITFVPRKCSEIFQ